MSNAQETWRQILVTVLGGLLVAAIAGGVVMYGEVQALKGAVAQLQADQRYYHGERAR